MDCRDQKAEPCSPSGARYICGKRRHQMFLCPSQLYNRFPCVYVAASELVSTHPYKCHPICDVHTWCTPALTEANPGMVFSRLKNSLKSKSLVDCSGRTSGWGTSCKPPVCSSAWQPLHSTAVQYICKTILSIWKQGHLFIKIVSCRS